MPTTKFVIRSLDRILLTDDTAKIPRPVLAFVAGQACLSPTWSQIRRQDRFSRNVSHFMAEEHDVVPCDHGPILDMYTCIRL